MVGWVKQFSITLSLALGIALSSIPAIADDCTATLAKVTDTQTLQTQYKSIAQQKRWNSALEGEMDYRRFISKESYDALKDKMHPVDMYGEKNYLAWKRAADFLDTIPVGKFELSIDLFSKLHEIASKEMYPGLKPLKYLIPAGILPTRGGVLKRRVSVGKDPIAHPLTEEQYQAIKNNPWLHGFIEIPWKSKPGSRQGFLVYATPSETRPKLEKLIQWYNENKSAMDPIELAARFQQAYVSIHPFIDGNGRTSRLLMDRILLEHGLPPAILTEQTSDIYLSPEAYTAQVREGIQTYLDLDAKSYTRVPPSAVNRNYSREKVGLGVRAANDDITQTKHHPAMSVNNWGTPETFLGGLPFVLMQDGFFYSPKGIPYAYHDGKLYPIADQAYLLYLTRQSNLGEKTVLLNAHRDIYRSHFHLLRQIRESKVSPDQIEVIPYSKIEHANNENQLFLHDWQMPLLKEAIEIRPTHAPSILSRGRYAQTEFEEAYINFPTQAKHSAPYVLAQYEATDLKFWKYNEYAKKQAPELLPEIKKSREKLWAAAREMIGPFLEDWKKLSPADREAMRRSAAFRAWEDYYTRSKLSYENFDTAMSSINDHTIFLLRSDATQAKYTGFHSQQDYKRIFMAMPGYKKIRAYLKGLETYFKDQNNMKVMTEKLQAWQGTIDANEKLIKLLPKGLQKLARDLQGTFRKFLDLLRLLNERVFGSKYEARGTSAEYERAWVDLTLHASGGTANKAGTSFTTSYPLLITSQPSENLPFSGSSLSSSVYLVAIPKEKVEWNSASTFSSEYEVISTKPISPFRIVENYSGVNLAKGLPSGLSPEASEFLRKYNFGAGQTEEKSTKMRDLNEFKAAAYIAYNKIKNDPNATEEQKKTATDTLNEKMKIYNEEYKKASN